MLGDKDTSCSLICAVCAGRLERVRKLVSTYSLSYSQALSDGYVLLRDAVENKHPEVAKLLLTNNSKVNSKKQKPTNTPLHFAVTHGYTEIVEMLLNKGANVDAKNQDGNTALHNAVKSNRMETVHLLLNEGAYVDTRNSYTITLLHLAVERGSEEIIRLLLQHGAYVNSACTSTYREGYTPLCLAVERGQEKFVQLLLECGANVKAHDKDGKTVLHFAVEKGYSLIIKDVLKHRPDVNNKSNRSSLNVAVHGYGIGYGKIIKNLLQYGFTVNPEDVNNCKLLHAAVQKGYLKMVEELLKYGIDVNMLYKATHGRSYMPLHVAAKNKQEEVAKLLISCGADVNAQDETGKPPIFYATQNADFKITKLLLTNKANVKDNPELLSIAVKKECREIVELLLDHGADVNTSDEYGRTALHFTALAEDGGFLLGKDPDINVKGEIAKLLLSCGANVNARTKKGITTLHVATFNGYVKVVEALLEHNADVNCTIKFGITPLHIAAQKGHIEIVEVLLKFGASIDSKGEYGRTALHIASKEGHKQIVIALLEHGSDVNIMSINNCTPLDFAMAGVSSFYNKVNIYDSDDDDDCYICGSAIFVCESIPDILERQIVKMKTANLYVSEKNLQSISRNVKISIVQKECEKEIASMKSERVGNANVSFYDILTKHVSQLAMYAGNESIVQIFRSDGYKVKFPIYASMINSNFRKGERRKKLLEQGNEVFHFLFNNFPQLPHDCTENIFSYLSDEDLRILIDA